MENGDDVDYDVKVGVIEDTLRLLNFGYAINMSKVRVKHVQTFLCVVLPTCKY